MWNYTICKNNCGCYLEKFFNSMIEGFAVHEIICHESGEAVDYRFLEVNSAFENITGLKKEEIIGKKVTEIHPDMKPHWIEIYGRVALSGESIRLESYFPELDKYFMVSAFSPGKGQFITFFSDITEIKKATEVLKRHYILFQNAQDIILYIKGDDCSIIDANKNAIIKYGYTYEELTKMKIQDIRHPSTMPTFTKEMNASDTEGVTFECLHVKKDNTSFFVEVSVKSVLINGETIRMHIIRDISERKKSEEKMAYLANYDSLTGIPNRGYLMEHLDTLIENAKRGGFKFAVMLFDIDKFKRINDTFGHNIGDIVLKNAAKRVKETLREVDFVARFGGDEFVIVLPYIKDKEDAKALAWRILEHIRKPVVLEDKELPTTISIGISIYPDDANDIGTLFKLSDKAMYVSKQTGGNKAIVYSECKDSI